MQRPAVQAFLKPNQSGKRFDSGAASDEVLFDVALRQLEMAPFHRRRRNRSAFGVPRRVELRAAAEQANLMVVDVDADPAVEIAHKLHDGAERETGPPLYCFSGLLLVWSSVRVPSTLLHC